MWWLILTNVTLIIETTKFLSKFNIIVKTFDLFFIKATHTKNTSSMMISQ